MRKLSYITIFTVIIMLFTPLFMLADPQGQTNSCPMEPYPISNCVTRGLQTITGMNFLASYAAESQIKKQLLKIAQGDFDVNLDTYSAMDLVAGKFKGFDIKGKNVVINDTHISSIEAKSLCNFVYLDYNSNPIKPLAPLYVDVKGTITEADINKTLTSQKFQEEIAKIKFDFINTQINLVEFQNTKIHIGDNQIFINSDIHFGMMPFTVPLRLATGLTAYKDKIRLTNFHAVAGDIGPMGSFIQMLNPTILNLDNFVKNGANINIKSLNIKDNKIDIDGTVWIPAAKG